jgi:hypothetical protein
VTYIDTRKEDQNSCNSVCNVISKHNFSQVMFWCEKILSNFISFFKEKESLRSHAAADGEALYCYSILSHWKQQIIG